MTLGVWMRGVIKLIGENLAAVPLVHFHCFRCFSTLQTLLASLHILAYLNRVYCHRFSSGILLACDSGLCSSSRTCYSCLCCCQVRICSLCLTRLVVGFGSGALIVLPYMKHGNLIVLVVGVCVVHSRD